MHYQSTPTLNQVAAVPNMDSMGPTQNKTVTNFFAGPATRGIDKLNHLFSVENPVTRSMQTLRPRPCYEATLEKLDRSTSARKNSKQSSKNDVILIFEEPLQEEQAEDSERHQPDPVGSAVVTLKGAESSFHEEVRTLNSAGDSQDLDSGKRRIRLKPKTVNMNPSVVSLKNIVVQPRKVEKTPLFGEERTSTEPFNSQHAQSRRKSAEYRTPPAQARVIAA